MVPVVAAAVKEGYQRRARTGWVSLEGGGASVDVGTAYGEDVAQLVMALLAASATNPHLLPVVIAQNHQGWDAVRGRVETATDSEDGAVRVFVRIQCANPASTDRIAYTLTVDDATVTSPVGPSTIEQHHTIDPHSSTDSHTTTEAAMSTDP